MKKEDIKALALTLGFKLKPQSDGSTDLNPYVYQFAMALLAAAPTPPAIVGHRLTYKDGSTAFIDRAPDSFELRECIIEPVTLATAAATTPPAQWWSLAREWKDEDLYECKVCHHQTRVHKDGVALPEECPNCNDRPGPTTAKPKFDKTYCSQCGGEFGPGDHGYSHCASHQQPADNPPAPEVALPDDFIGSVKRLVFIARTSGGTAGRDRDLCAALSRVEAMLEAIDDPDWQKGMR